MAVKPALCNKNREGLDSQLHKIRNQTESKIKDRRKMTFLLISHQAARVPEKHSFKHKIET